MTMTGTFTTKPAPRPLCSNCGQRTIRHTIIRGVRVPYCGDCAKEK